MLFLAKKCRNTSHLNGLAQFCVLMEKFIHMKRLGYPLVLVFVSLVSVVFFTTVTAVTLVSYSKAEKISSTIVKGHMGGEGETVRR